MNNKKKAVVLLSGGMDSAVCAAIAMQDGYQVAALHLNYGQKTEAKELECFENLCNHYKIEDKLVVDVSHLSKIGGSSLTDESIEVSVANLESEEIPSSYVPFRNGNILSIAASWAEVTNAEALYIGAMQLDSSGYPDCRQEFFDAFEKAINLGNKPETEIRIKVPLIDMTKKDIVEVGSRLGVPFEYTWSCYQSQEKACGKCDSCALRLRGFARAGIEDPLVYENKPIYR
jgi:7-cyano-7-deazaguanine synthase